MDAGDADVDYVEPALDDDRVVAASSLRNTRMNEEPWKLWTRQGHVDDVVVGRDEHTVVLVVEGGDYFRELRDRKYLARAGDALAALVAAASVRRQALAALGCCRKRRLWFGI